MDIALLSETLRAIDDRPDEEAAPHKDQVWKLVSCRIAECQRPVALGLTRRAIAILAIILALLLTGVAAGVIDWAAVFQNTYVHAYTGELLYTGDYSDFINQQDTSDLRTAPPKTTQDPQWWYDDDENVIWAEETPKPSEGTDIGQSSARSIADRYLSAKYAKFSQQEFSRVSCLHITDPTESGGFQVPYYQFDYFMIHGTGEDQREDLAYEIIINAYTKEIEYCSAASLGEGNG